MEGLAIALAGIAVVWIIIWSIRNENVSSIAEQKGLLRMVDHAPKSEEIGREDKGKDE
jgi:hypothetical protein